MFNCDFPLFIGQQRGSAPSAMDSPANRCAGQRARGFACLNGGYPRKAPSLG